MKKQAIKILPQQGTLSPALPKILGCKDYRETEELLKRIDEVISKSGIQEEFVFLCLEQWHEEQEEGAKMDESYQLRYQQQSIQALRSLILKHLYGYSYPGLSVQLAQSALMRKFCRLEELEQVRIPSKSSLQRYLQRLWHPMMEKVLESLTQAAAGVPIENVEEEEAQVAASQRSCGVKNPIGLEEGLDLESLWLDSTCLQAHMHFPVDWVLLVDACRTLLRAILVIRKHGLKHRITEPKKLLREVNKLAIAMTQSRRQVDSKKKRKEVFRALQKITKVIARHGKRYHKVLEQYWKQETDLRGGQVQCILERINSIMQQLPAAQKQAYERIIGERQVASKQKLLSLYQDHVHVIVRGKSGAEVEFGNRLFLVEESNGFIVDHQLMGESSGSDHSYLAERLKKLQGRCTGKLQAMGCDRGFDSEKARELLEQEGIFNGICPKALDELKKRREESRFVAMQSRRNQTEARVAILKNVFLEEVPKVRGYKRRELAVDWAVLSHNVWVLARLLIKQAKEREEVALAS